MTYARILKYTISGLVLSACAPMPKPPQVVPAVEYANRIKAEYARANPEYRAQLARTQGFASASYLGASAQDGPQAMPARYDNTRASLRLVSESETPGDPTLTAPLSDTELQGAGQGIAPSKVVDGDQPYNVYESKRPLARDYTGPLALGEPGVSASLWREGRPTSLFRDYRAFQPMDLITILVTENTEGKSEATTNVKQESTISAAITYLFGLESTLAKTNKQVDPANLINGSMKSEFKGDGESERKGKLKGRISAMVAEVLPSGVLRIEGQKIVQMNNEEETMIISGLVRTEDVTSSNEVDSAKVANMRIDYFGKGTIGDAQHGGWLARVVRRLWPL